MKLLKRILEFISEMDRKTESPLVSIMVGYFFVIMVIAVLKYSYGIALIPGILLFIIASRFYEDR
tara:strand:+ start:97 stop:291 length:195 start_codon:yes stop_codon:yes gene_type:complete